jgi:hypothetical protein
MIKDNIQDNIHNKLKEVSKRIPYVINEEQEKLIVMISKEIILDLIDNLEIGARGEEKQLELEKIKQVWKQLNQLLK